MSSMFTVVINDESTSVTSMAKAMRMALTSVEHYKNAGYTIESQHMGEDSGGYGYCGWTFVKTNPEGVRSYNNVYIRQEY